MLRNYAQFSAVPGNFFSHPKECCWKFQRRGGFRRQIRISTSLEAHTPPHPPPSPQKREKLVGYGFWNNRFHAMLQYFQKISIPNPWKDNGNSEGVRGGGLKSQNFEKKVWGLTGISSGVGD